MSFQFSLEQQLDHARAGHFVTDHGRVETPVFMPVGTQATVKSLDSQDITATRTQIILGNTYHLYLRPGPELVAELGGLHNMMNWTGPILTDSGGFQVFSLGQVGAGKSLVKIDQDKVVFRSHLDGSEHTFTPTGAVEIQRQLGADIMMAFDECTPHQSDRAYAAAAMARTHDWAAQCVQYWEQHHKQSAQGHYQALFGIVQGGHFDDLRQQSASFTSQLPFDGIAVGGETIGYDMDGTEQVMAWIEPLLPADKPRYAMGLGRDPEDLIRAVRVGFDMFDCVGPTRLARNGSLFVGQLNDATSPADWQFESPFPKGRLHIGTTTYRADQQVIDPRCDCHTCREGYSRAYLHHLYKTKELSYYRLASIHNVRSMIRLTEQLRQRIIRQ